MVDIIITIPNDKVPLARNAIKHHIGDAEDMSDAELIQYVKNRWIRDLRQMASKYQEHEFTKEFRPDDPVSV